MKKGIISFVLAMMSVAGYAQSVVGKWVTEGGESQVEIYQSGDKLNGKIVWLKSGDGKLDTKNPDKKLRNVPCDQIVLFSGLKYDADDKEWNGTKIYDPQRGMRAKLTVRFEKDGRLRLRGSLLGIGESVYWNKIKE